ncbi:MAG: S8 family serine peptidase [Acidobacteriota bacterium]
MNCTKHCLPDGQAKRVLLGVLVAALGLLPAPGTDYKIDRQLMNVLADDAEAAAPFFVVLAEKANVKAAHRMSDWSARGRFVVQALRSTANRSQAGVRGYLQAQGAAFTPYWIENRIFVPKGTLALARALAQRPEVVAIVPETILAIPRPQAQAIQAIEWNIAKIRADQVWSTSRGAGTVVANIDTGVQFNHPALVAQYRGNTGGAFFHSGNWKDPTGLCGGLAPCDNNGHGTHTMGTMVGSDGGANQIGVAPAARWIACKGCTTNQCFSSHLIACAQWALDPREDGSSSDRPHVVNNSWGGGGGNPWFQSYVENWRAAGIFPAFSIGNSGPGCGTAGSPGDYPGSFASGATDSGDLVFILSSRGPSAFGGIKPNVSAPGVNVRSSVPTDIYATYSGTSMASPHSAGTVALVWSAAPAYLGNVGGTEQLLKDSAMVLTTSETCGGMPAFTSPNNTYGWGRIDAREAVNRAAGPVNQPPVVTVTSPPNGAAFICPMTVNFTGTASDLEDGDLTSSIAWSDNGTGFGAGGSVSKSYACTEAGDHTVVARVTDSLGATDTDSVTITIVNPTVPAAPGNLVASVSGSAVTLSWRDNSANETGFRLERKPKSGNWSVTATIGANVTTHQDSPGRGNWQYRVRAFNAAGNSDPSNIVSVRVR